MTDSSIWSVLDAASRVVGARSDLVKTTVDERTDATAGHDRLAINLARCLTEPR